MENERYVLNQVSVRLKLQEEAPLYSTTQIDTPQRAIEVMKDMMKDLDREYVYVVNMDGASHPINFSVVSIGTINASPVCMRELLKTAILSNAASLLMFHNHPGADATPSREDHMTTAKVMAAAEAMGFTLLDHIIVAGCTGEYFSYKEALKDMFSMEGICTFLKMNGIINNPLAKVEELEEENYNQIDNQLSNTKPKQEEIREKRQEEERRTGQPLSDERSSLLAKMHEKKTMVDERKTGSITRDYSHKEEKTV